MPSPSLDHDAIAADLATQFTAGNLDRCRDIINGLAPEAAGLVCVTVYGIHITTDKETARKWDGFLRRLAQGR